MLVEETHMLLLIFSYFSPEFLGGESNSLNPQSVSTLGQTPFRAPQSCSIAEGWVSA